MKTDIKFQLSHRLRTRVRKVLLHRSKVGSAVRDIGCSGDELALYLKNKFTPQMTWPHFMAGLIHIDHIIPLSSFNLENREEFLKACHYTNLQPLWATTQLARDNGDMISIGNIEKADNIN